MYTELHKYVESMNLRKFNRTKEMRLDANGKTYKQIRDVLMRIGRIIAEEEDKQIYVATMSTGRFGNEAVVALGACNAGLYIKAYAKEGLLKQKTCERALQIISKEIA